MKLRANIEVEGTRGSMDSPTKVVFDLYMSYGRSNRLYAHSIEVAVRKRRYLPLRPST